MAYGTMQIKPLIEPTKQILKLSVKHYEWHELFPTGKYHIFLLRECRELKIFDYTKEFALLQFRVMPV